jgi:hypothetical protein
MLKLGVFWNGGRVVYKIGTKISEEYTASFYRVDPGIKNYLFIYPEIKMAQVVLNINFLYHKALHMLTRE